MSFAERRTVALSILSMAALAFTSDPCQAELGREGVSLDSRTIPHPHWIQVSGQVETAVVERASGNELLVVMLQASEGGRVRIDIDPAQAVDGLTLQRDDYIHVRGVPVHRDGEVTIVAGELYADGRVVQLDRASGQAKNAEPHTKGSEALAFSPAAPRSR